MHPSMREYDLVVIGSGPGEQKAAIAAAKLGKTVAIIERDMMLGGVCTNTGTIPSKTLREAVLYLTGITQRELYGASYHVKENITPADLLTRTKHVIGKEQDVVRSQLIRNRIELYTGHGRFIDKHTVLVEDQHGGERVAVSGRHIVIATGTKPAQPPGVEFDEERVLDSDGILNLKFVPASMVVVGAGVIGIEYASMFAALGTKVTVVEKRHTMLDFCDPEIVEALQFHLRELAVTFRFGEEVTAVDVGASGTLTTLASGKQIPADAVMYSAGRQGQTDHLDLANAGLETDSRNDLISSMTALPALVSAAHNRGRHRSRKRDNHRKSTRLTRFRKCPKGSHAKDRRVRIAGSSGARRAIAAVRHRGIRISRTPAFAVAVITPLVFAGVVGAAAPTPMLRDATITPVAIVAPTSRDPLGPKVIAIQQQPESFHIAGTTVSAPAPTVVMNSPGALGIPTIALSAYRNAEQIVTASDPACGISWNLLAGIGRIESMHANGGATDARGTAIHPIYGPALDGTLPGNEVNVQSNVSGRITYARAMGPMQFLPDTWARYASDGKGDGVADPQNLYDSTLAAARYLCSGAHNLRDPTQVMTAILRYNNSMSYAQNVLGWAAAYATGVVPIDLPPITGRPPPLGDAHDEHPEGLGPGLPMNIMGPPVDDPLAHTPLIDFGPSVANQPPTPSGLQPAPPAPTCTLICIGSQDLAPPLQPPGLPAP